MSRTLLDNIKSCFSIRGAQLQAKDKVAEAESHVFNSEVALYKSACRYSNGVGSMTERRFMREHNEN